MNKYILKTEYKNVILTIPNFKMGNGTITIDTKNIDEYDPETLIGLGFHIFDIEKTEVKKYTNEKNERKSKKPQE